MERTETLIIDASVALKWFIEEENSHKALLLRDKISNDITPIVPTLFFYEIINVLRYKTEFGINDIKKVLESLIDFQFVIEDPEKELMEKTIDLAFKYGTTIYDASYLALGEKYDTKLITADKKLVEKISSEKYLLLSEFTI